MLEKTFFCHAWSNDKHASALALENVLNHIQAKFEITAPELIELADDLRTANELAKAMLYYHAACVVMSRSTTPSGAKLGKRTSCSVGFKHLVDSFIEKKDLAIVFNFILPLMNDLVQAIKSQASLEKEDKAKGLAWTTLFIALCHIRLENWLKVKSKTKEAMSYMTNTFQNRAAGYWVFGACCHYYGRSLFKLGDTETAIQELKKAVLYRNSANDYKTADDKRTKIANTESLLKYVEYQHKTAQGKPAKTSSKATVQAKK